MRAAWIIGGAAFGVAVGGAVGGFVGWALGDFGGRSDPENVWFLSLITGAAVGLAIAIAFILRHIRRIRWGSSLLVGAMSGIAAGVAVVALVAWQRRP
jgi:hypothetical protein